MNKISECTAKSILVDYKCLAAVKPSEKVAQPIYDSVELLNNIKFDPHKYKNPSAAEYAFKASPMVATPICDFGSPLDFGYRSSACPSAARSDQLIANPMESGKKTSR